MAASITGSARLSAPTVVAMQAASRPSIPSFTGMRAAGIPSAAKTVKLGASRSAMAKGVFAAALPSKYGTVAPVGDRVFVQLPEKKTETAGGILLPSASQGKSSQGTVVNVGKSEQMNAGDTVVYSQFAGTEVTMKGDDYIILKADDCIGTLGGAGISSLKPLGDRVLIKITTAEESTMGGVLLPDAAKEKPLTGEVVAVGPGSKGPDGEMTAITIPVGATVLYQKFSGSEFDEEDGAFVVVKEMDIMAVLS